MKIEVLFAEKLFNLKKITVFVTRGTRSNASYSFPSNSTTTTKRFVQMKAAL